MMKYVHRILSSSPLTKSKEGQEILEDVMLREATREFFEFVKAVLKIETAAASAVAQTTDATDGNVAQQQQQQAEAVEVKKKRRRGRGKRGTGIVDEKKGEEGRER